MALTQPKFESHIIDSMEMMQSLCNYVESLNPEYTVFDVETDSAIEKKANLYGLGLCFNTEYAFYIVLKDKNGQNIWTNSELSFIKNWFFNLVKKTKLIAHNAIYDILVIENNWNINIEEYLYSDTILQKHTINEEKPFGLKEIAVNYLGEWADNAQERLKESVLNNGGVWKKDQKDMYKADTNILGEYCNWDVILTFMLFEIFEEQIKKENLYTFFYEEEVMPLYKLVTINMKRQGFPIDLEHFNNLKKNLNLEITRLEKEIMEDIKSEIYDFEKEILDKNYGVKYTGNFPKYLAKVLDIELPKTKRKNKETGEITESTTLSAKALQKELDNCQDKLKQSFFKFLIQKNQNPCDLFGYDTVRKAQENWFFDKNKEKNHIFNLKSPDHIRYLVYNVIGIKATKFTDSKKPSADAEIIDELITLYQDKHKYLPKFLDYRKLTKLLTTYVDGIIDRQIDGKIYTSMLQFGTTSGRYASRAPNCLSMDTEILTKEGWKNFDQLNSNEIVACFNPNLERIEFLPIKNKWKSKKIKQDMTRVKNVHIDMLMTSNHRCLFQSRKTGKYIIKPANSFLKDAKIIHSKDTFFEEKGYDLNYLKLMVACQADAEIRKDCNNVRFVFTKKRKYERLIDIILHLNLDYEDRSRNCRYEIILLNFKKDLIKTLGINKTFPTDWINLGSIERKIVLEELFYWDGSFTHKNNYSSNNETNVDILQAMFVLDGKRAHKREYLGNKSKSINFQLDITDRNYSLSSNVFIEQQELFCEVWCVEVPTELFIARRGSDTFITGNCQNLPRPKDEDSGLSKLVLKYGNAIREGFIAPEGYKIIDADYSALEPRCFSEVSSDPKLIEVWKKGEDLYSRIAIDVFKLEGVSALPSDKNYLKKLQPEFRQKTKVFCLAVVYGAEAGRIAQAMGISWKEANEIIELYLKAYPGLKKYMKMCDWEAKKYGVVKTKFGRVRHLEKAHRIYNLYGPDILNKKWAEKNNLKSLRRELKNYLNNAKNFKIQGLAGHIINRASIGIAKELKKRKLKSYIGLQIHDQLALLSPIHEVEEVKHIVQDRMENTTKLSVPLIAEPEVADNLKESH